MTEDFLHHIWGNGLYRSLSIAGNRSAGIEVLRCGERNSNAGPDFFNALIRIDGLLLAGNVEIHINSSDWYRHGHHTDKAYDTVILQLVVNDDVEVKRTTGDIVPTAVLSFDPVLRENYNHLLENESWIACSSLIKRTGQGLTGQWLESLAVMRIKEKADRIREIWHMNNRCWEETIYQQLAHNFGFSLNSAAFELVARSIPYRHLLRHRDSLFRLEALLFGQAGMLNEQPMPTCKRINPAVPVTAGGGSEPAAASVGIDEYYLSLKKEYAFFKTKYKLRPVERHLWRFLRLRPANFPTLRIAQFAALLYKKTSIMSTVLDCRDLKPAINLFRVSASGYWDTRYMFNRPSAVKQKSLGILAARSLVINTVAPILYLYGKYRQESEYCGRAVRFLRELPPETNSIVTGWTTSGVKPESAWHSQALLHLKNEFCNYRRCLDCRIGSHIIFRIPIEI